MREPPPHRIFSVAEADELVPEMDEILDEIQHITEDARTYHEKIQILELLWGEKVTEPHNPDHEELRSYRRSIRLSQQRIEKIVHQRILSRGIRIPSGGLEHGLLDFPTTLDGRIVFLCWKRGEPRIAFWHEIRGGYAGRQQVTPEVAVRMGH